jgi:hypothetical protein
MLESRSPRRGIVDMLPAVRIRPSVLRIALIVLVACSAQLTFPQDNIDNPWKQIDLSRSDLYFGFVSINGNQNGIMAAATADGSGVYFSLNGGETWQPPKSPLVSKKILVHPSGRLFLVKNDDVVHYSDDNGGSWPGCEWMGGSAPNLPVYSYDIAIDSAGRIFSCGRSTGVVRSDDAGATWSLVPCPGDYFPFMNIVRNGTIFVSTPYIYGYSHYGPLYYNYVRVSTNAGTSWSVIAPGPATGVTQALVSTAGGTLIAGTSSGVYRSTDSGATWTEATGFMPIDVRSFATNALDEVFAASPTLGVYRSTNQGRTWTAFNRGFSDVNAACLYCDPKGFLYAGTVHKDFSTVSAGLFRTTRSTDGTDTLNNGGTGDLYRLSQNYPNPFSLATTVRCQLPVPSGVRLVVYDLIGREVAVLFNGDLGAGSHEYTFDASGLASGVYFCRMTTDTYSATRTMILVR